MMRPLQIAPLILGIVWLAIGVAIPSAQQTARTHEFHGTVEAVDPAARTVTVKGENVEGWMGAMTMV